ncbi:Hsp20/alpha crystallin family protein [Bacteriovorax sp. Seq25_V]|uniref:Hsp20/alpha crystallin family protein n=1 Tax=Bacteriovorax sp. Seq25_V TaxID=1201288 RepID=UPI000389FC69|nr:Hsp20/alpha crystallin family protein [Bacteriovorax sp. Seq25_V]EQC47986.1 Hsp20/alpha crystallin family protein [Bacteriovorax sp. Seq25_V]
MKHLALLVLLTSSLSAHCESTGSERKPFNPFDPQAQVKQKFSNPGDARDIGAIKKLFFGNSIQGITGSIMESNDVEIEAREDDKFKYVDIIAEGVNKDDLKINIKDEMIMVSGQIKKEEKNESGEIISSFTSSFMRSVPVPENVDSLNPDFDLSGKKIIIKFKRK